MLRTVRTPILLLLLLLAPVAGARTEPFVGAWEGSIDPEELDLRVVVRFEPGDGGLAGRIDVPLQGARDLPLADVEVGADGAIRFRAPALPGAPVFEGRLARGGIEGTFRRGAIGVPFRLERPPRVAPVPTPPGGTATWRGTLAPGLLDARVVLRLEDADGALAGTLDLPDDGLFGLELRFVAAGRGITAQVPALPGDATLGLRRDGDLLEGSFVQEGYAIPLQLVREGVSRELALRPQTPVAPFPYRVEEVGVDAGDARLAGTLALPEGAGPFPAALLLSDAGPQDRDGTVAGHAPYAVVADALARAGVAVLRLDDRGVGGSGGAPYGAGHARLARDAAAAVALLAARPEIDARRIALVGHGEGGVVAARAIADEGVDAAAVALLATPAVDGAALAILQNRLQLELAGADEARIAAQADYLRALADAHAAGDVAAARRLTRDHAEALLGDGPPRGAAREELVARQVEAAASPAFRDLLLARPQDALRGLRVPTLAIYGRLDAQVPAVQNEGPMRAALRLAGAPDARVVTLPGLNHLLQPAVRGGADEYDAIRTTVAPEALELLRDWLVPRLAR